MMTAKTLTTERLTLRAPQSADAPDIARLVNDWEIARWLTQVPHPYTLADAEIFISRQTSGKTWLMEDQQGLVGCIGTQGEFGYWLGRAFWGRGYATEASRVLLPHHFETDGATLRSGHAVDNLRSRAVLLKLGFRDTHQEKRVIPVRDEVRDQQVMELSAADWEGRA